MNDLRLLVFAVTLHTLLLPSSCGGHNHHRRSMAVQGGLPMSKGGWRPVVGTSGLFYGSYNAPQLHSPAYKIPIPVLDTYPSSSRPVGTKDTTKITSIAQSYRPTTLRTASGASTVPVANQPINSYYNPFALQNNGFTNYKFIQNYPTQSVIVRNPHNPYADRNIYSKYPNKVKQNNPLQLTNIQPIQFGQYQASKPLDIFGKPIETYFRPNDGKKPQSSNIETFKPEVFKLDNDAAPQSVNQQVKTAQQHTFVGVSNVGNPYPQYTFQDSLLPPNILGTFGTFGVQSVKGRDPIFQFPTTLGPSQQTKQTYFNSYSYSPTYRTSPSVYDATTPRAPVTSSKINFGTTYSDLKIAPAPPSKLQIPPKIDPNAELKNGFKPSPQDPFSKNYQSDFNKVFGTTYNPPVQTTTLSNNYYEYNFPIQQNQQSGTYQDRPNPNINYENKKHITQDSALAGNQQLNLIKSHSEIIQSSHRPTYEVTETTESELGTNSSPTPWSVTPVTYDYSGQKATNEPDNYVKTIARPGDTSTPDIPEEVAIVTEAEKVYGNSLSYDSRVESQSRRPISDDFEPIGMDKLKDYYYKVSTPIYNDYTTSRRTKPAEPVKYTSTQQTTTQFNNNKENNREQPAEESLPTLPPTRHYKRPMSSDITEKDRIRKRNKVRRRRPQITANVNHSKEETSTRITTRVIPTTAFTPETTPKPDVEEVYTIRPRIRPTKPQQNLTTPTITTDLSTSAIPTISPTTPTIVKKNLAHRRPFYTTTTTSPETTTPIRTESTYQDDLRKDSQIMKISSRTPLPKFTYDYTNDFTHKQDEKDTPTSDVTINLSDTLKTNVESEQDFSFHKHVKPIEAKLEPMRHLHKEATTALYKEESSDYTTTTRSEFTTTERSQGPRIRNKYHRNKFNVKDYRSRLNSTTSTTDRPGENTPTVKFPQRRLTYSEIENETTTERKRFMPKEPRHKNRNGAESNAQTDKDKYSHNSSRQRQTTTDSTEPTTVKASPRVRNGQRRPRPTEETTETTSPISVHSKRPIRKTIMDTDIAESVQDFSVTESPVNQKSDITSERTRSESAIMKIADKKHHDHIEHLFEHSKRVSDLTLAASKDYNKPGLFKTVSSNSRRIPNYFTIATDDPILPIEAFFPQLNQKKES